MLFLHFFVCQRPEHIHNGIYMEYAEHKQLPGQLEALTNNSDVLMAALVVGEGTAISSLPTQSSLRTLI